MLTRDPKDQDKTEEAGLPEEDPELIEWGQRGG